MANKEEKKNEKDLKRELKEERKEERKEEKLIRAANVTEFKIKVVAPIKIDEFARECLKSHNFYRRLHKSPQMNLDLRLGGLAMRWATNLAHRDKMEHNPAGDLGENIYFCSGFEPTGYEVTKSWYDEVHTYDFGKSQFSVDTGHFTALVWAASRRLGVGVGRSASGNYYVVAYYDPPGNVSGKFAANVKPAKKRDANAKASRVSRTIVGRGWTCKSCCATMCCRPKFDQFQKTCLDMHNQYRQRHESPPMKLNLKMCGEAQSWAENLAASNEVSFIKQSHAFAQNLLMVDEGDEVDGAYPVHEWYKGIKKYNGSFVQDTAPFAQVVWAASVQLGVGVAMTRTGEVYVVAHYFPPGNIRNEQGDNVKKWKEVQKYV